MSYLTYNNKRVIAGSKYVVGAIELINRLTSWSNIDFDTFSSSGIDITSAIETSATYGRCRSNEYPIIGGDPINGTITFKFYLTVNSGTAPRVQFFRNGSLYGTYGFSYSGPGEYTVAAQVLGSGLSGNYSVGFINDNGITSFDTNFSATNCRMFTEDGDGNPYTP